MEMYKYSDSLKPRIFAEATPTKHRFLRPIIKAMERGIVIEFNYNKGYNYTAPVCLKEFEGHWYLLGWNKDYGDKVYVYALDKITSIGEHWITFSLHQKIDYGKFIDTYFNINNVL